MGWREGCGRGWRGGRAEVFAGDDLSRRSLTKAEVSDNFPEEIAGVVINAVVAISFHLVDCYQKAMTKMHAGTPMSMDATRMITLHRVEKRA